MAATFFERQHHVRRMSFRLVLLFIVAVIAIVAVVDAVVFLVIGGAQAPASTVITWLLVVSAVTVGVIGLSSWIRTILLRGGGGGKVARELGGVYVPEDTTDPSLRRLRNVVEEMAIASGVSVPEVYVLEHEAGINAFAAGWTPADAAVAVTRGALDRLNRDELQGVIAHEFSHVINGDMRLNIRLMGLLFGILVLAIVGRMFLYSRGGGDDKGRSAGAQLALIGIAAMLAGYIGVLAGRIIKAAVSRQREYLADASAVQYTRQTSGLVGALKKIGGLPEGSKLHNGKVEDVSHMLFGNGFRLSSLFATHPPLPDRIKALDPSFNPEELSMLAQQWASAPPSGLAEDASMGLVEGHSSPLPEAGQAMPVHPSAVSSAVAAPAEPAYVRASAVIASIPDAILQQVRQSETVMPIVVGLLMSPDNDIRTQQHALLVSRYGQELADTAWRAQQQLSSLHPAARLPLAELAFPTLRRLDPRQQERVAETVDALIRVDGLIHVFEYCLSRLLRRDLQEAMNWTSPWKGGGGRRLTDSSEASAVATLFAVLSQVGDDDPPVAEQAYQAGVGQLYSNHSVPFTLPPDGVVALDETWPVLDQLAPHDKQRLIEGIVEVISHDGVMTVAEIELLRTVCALLHCPLPPLADWGE